MSLKQIAAEKMDKLRVARLYARNTQLSGEDPATHGATTAQQTGLKALIANGSACNQTRNHGAITHEKHAQLSPPETPPKVARVAEGFSGGCAPVALSENQPVAMPETDPVADTFTAIGMPSVLSFRPIADSGDHQAANDPTPSPSGGEVQPCAPLVSQEDLHQVQRELLPHLATCRDCCIEEHLYCHQAERTGNGYAAYLTEFPDAAQRHADYVAVVIQARIRGLQAGFTALEALTRHDRDTCRETAREASYGIDKRPAEQAFVNHFTACAYCFPRSGKYCGEGRELHELAMMETLQ